MNKNRVGVVFGRFQPLTASQFEDVIVPAINENEYVIIVLGDSFRPATPQSPFDAEMRTSLIREAILEVYPSYPKCFIVPIRKHFYDATKTLCEIQDEVNFALRDLGLDKTAMDVTLYGSALKGDKELFNQFPRWNTRILPARDGENSDSLVRNQIYDEIREGELTLDSWREEVPPSSIALIEYWTKSLGGRLIAEEDSFISGYIKSTQVSKYPIIFQTVDNVVIYKGNILLVERGAKPGRGQLALPGGFLKHDLSMLEGAMKELREETRFRVNKEWLVGEERFSAPDRSLRGRTITQAFLWKVPDYRDVPEVVGSSDAKRAQWYELSEVLNERIGDIFEDHLDIIEAMVSRL